MAQYTRSAAEQFRPEEATVGWLWNIFVFSIVVFGSIALLYLGMEFGYKKFLEKELTTVQSNIDAKKGEIKPEDQKHLGEFYSQVYNVNRLLLEHPAISKIFSFLEANTNVAVSYDRFSSSRTSKSITINVDGYTKSFELVAKQLEALRRRPEVKDVILGNAAYEEGKIRFNIRIVLEPQYFQSG